MSLSKLCVCTHAYMCIVCVHVYVRDNERKREIEGERGREKKKFCKICPPFLNEFRHVRVPA